MQKQLLLFSLALIPLLSDAQTLLKDINPGPSGSAFRFATGVNNRLICTAYNPATGNVLWTSDGTSEGTVPLLDSATGTSVKGTLFGNGLDYHSETRFLHVGNKIIFLGSANNNKRQLYQTDGTRQGTKLFKELGPKTMLIYFGLGEPAVLNGNNIFLTVDSVEGVWLWQTDRTKSGTVKLKQISSSPKMHAYAFWGFALYKSKVYFFFAMENNECVLWETDGTAAGTKAAVILHDIEPLFRQDPPITVFKDKMLFCFNDLEHGLEPWVSDGTPSGTHLLKDCVPGRPGSGAGIFEFYVTKDYAFFTGWTLKGSYEVWRTDGTSAGTQVLKDFRPGLTFNGNEDYKNVVYYDSCGLYFFAHDGVHGKELWFTDGSRIGTRLVKDIKPGPAGAQYIVAPKGVKWGSHIIFPYIIDSLMNEIWMTDGTNKGTVPISVSNFPFGTKVDDYITFQQRIFFAENDGIHGYEPRYVHFPADTVIINSRENISIELLPNPASRQVNLVVKTIANNLQGYVVMYDATGKLLQVYTRHFQCSCTSLSIPIFHLPAGQYLIAILVNGQKLTRKLVVL
jgi:ELWxxDGT repeat protein